MNADEKLKELLVNSIDLSRDISDDELNEIISSLVRKEYGNTRMSLREMMKLCRDLYNSVRGLDVLQDILDDKDITEIMINGYDRIFIEREGKLFRYNGAFSSDDKFRNVIQIIASGANKRVNEASPILDTRLADGSRVNVVLSPVSVKGPSVTIRKFPSDPLTMDRLTAMGAVTEDAALYLKKLVENGYNIFISGGTGSGKTTFLNALSGYIPADERIITIEDSAELQLRHAENLVSLECRQANSEGDNEVTVRDLIRASLRMRPDRIIVGEVRGAEAFDMLQAMNTGHDGSLSTGHGNSPVDMLSRLEAMTLMAGEELPLSAIRRQIASALDILVHLGRMRDGSRKVMSIYQVETVSEENIVISALFDYSDNDRKNPSGHLMRTGIPLRVFKGDMVDSIEKEN
ncbi:MAG: CpaF family protein [Parasporobacterium sp.]|nr:CpaF family protein [Parasporobacterium sp.]